MSLVDTATVELLNTVSVGSVSTLGTLNGDAPIVGPLARIRRFCEPVVFKPPETKPIVRSCEPGPSKDKKDKLVKRPGFSTVSRAGLDVTDPELLVIITVYSPSLALVADGIVKDDDVAPAIASPFKFH